MKPLLPTLLALALLACSQRPSPSPTAPPSASSPAPPPPLSAPPPHPTPGAIADAYRGTLDPDLAVVVRLRRDGDALHGSYFYEKSGTDLALAGAVAADGTFTLDETAAGRKTGSFAGQVGPGGKLSGAWTDAKGGKTRGFQLVPIPRVAGAPAIVVRRVKRSRTRSKVPAPPGVASVCAVEIAYPEVLGLADAKVEAKINDLLRRTSIGALLDDCDTPDDVKGDYAVHLNRGGLLGVSTTWSDNCVVCAHPAAGGAAVNVSLDTGAVIPFARILAPGGKAKLATLLQPIVARRIKATEGATADNADMLTDAYLSGAYVLEEDGVRLIAFYALAHAVQALDGELGVVLPYASLRGVLDPAGPAVTWRGLDAGPP